MKKIWLFMIPFSIILISFTGCVRNSYSFEEPIDEIESIEIVWAESSLEFTVTRIATVYKGNIIKNLIMDCQSYTKYRPNETTGGIFVSWRRKEKLPTGA